jgi:hypothetical protein
MVFGTDNTEPAGSRLKDIPLLTLPPTAYAADGTVPAAAAAATADTDDALRRGWCWIVRLSQLVILTTLAGLLVHGGLVFHDCYNAEVAAKEHAEGAWNFHCREIVKDAKVLASCGKQAQIIKRNTWLSAWEHTVEHHYDEIPGVSYCRARPDMCAMMTLKALDALYMFLHLVPIIVGALAVYYFWPLLGSCLMMALQRSGSSDPKKST